MNYEYRWTNTWIDATLAVDPGIDPFDWAGCLQWTSAGGGRLQMNGNWDGNMLRAAMEISNNSLYQSALQSLYNSLNHVSNPCPANFGITTYQWNLMADDQSQLPPGGVGAVATLCYHAGVAVKMEYGIRGSGAYTSEVEHALERYFGYDQDATYGTKNINTINTMTEEIQWLRPIEFAGDDPRHGGHAWVVYGYNKGTDPNRQFRMNMGWPNSSGDGWYSCDNIDCLDNDKIPDFNMNQEHVTRIAQLNMVKFVGDNNSGDGSPDNPYKGIEEAIIVAPNDATLIFKAGSDNTLLTSTLVIKRPFTLKGKDVTIRKQ